MVPTSMHPARGRDPRWRLVIWGLPLALLMVPAVAMRLTDEVRWSLGDFAVMGALLALTAAAIDLVTAAAWPRSRKVIATGTALLMFLTSWALLATG